MSANRSVLMISPGYPAEMPYFVRGLAATGVRVIGLGDQHVDALPEMSRRYLSDYLQIPSFADEGGILARVAQVASSVAVDQVESLWEPTMVLAARMREMLGIAGMSVEQTIPFRDKERMKQVLDAAGIRTPHHYSATDVTQVREAVDRIGYPIIVKPIAGAGSANTHRVESDQELEHVLPQLRRVPEVSVEEFVDAEEFTYDTICSNGHVLYENISWYHPRPLVSRQLEWVSPVTLALRDMHVPYLASGVRMGREVLRALGFRAGFTHMEWYLRSDGEAVFGEIAARPPGARTVDVMNFAADTDLFQRWAEAAVYGHLGEPIVPKYNAASIMKRAQGQGHIARIEGLTHLLAEYDDAVCSIELLPIGVPRRDWLATLVSDGMVIVRHEDLITCTHIADRFASELQIYAA